MGNKNETHNSVSNFKDLKYQDTACQGREKYTIILKANILNYANNHSNHRPNTGQ